MHSDKNTLSIFFVLFALLLLGSLYFHVNIGGSGFRIPSNIVVWLFGSLIAFWGLYKAAINPVITLPRFFWMLAAFPVLALFSGIFSGVEVATDWFLRLFYIWGGLLFLFSLFQFNLKPVHQDRLLLMVVIAGGLHACVGLFQIFMGANVPSWIPNNPDAIPTGVFQQINNQGSLQATVIIIAMWLLTRPISLSTRLTSGLLIVSIACASFIISYSGSRIALLGLVLAVPLLLLSRFYFVKRQPLRWILVVFVMTASAFAASQFENQRGLGNATAKLQAINSGYSTEARLGIYKIGFDLIQDKPFFGHGIGSFIKSFQLAKPDFYEAHPDAKLPSQRVSHPHNEVIFWLVEGGATAGVGIILLVIGVFAGLAKLPWRRRYAYAGMLLPIALHTQVELPFYISSLHWFVILLILFVTFYPLRRQYANQLSKAASQLLKFVAFAGAVASTVFMTHTMAANLEYRSYIKHESDPESPFDIAMTNPYFKRQATHAMMTLLYQQSRQNGIQENIVLFADWSEEWVKQSQSIGHYKLTVNARLDLGQDERACKLAKQALRIYPTDKGLADLNQKCKQAGYL